MNLANNQAPVSRETTTPNKGSLKKRDSKDNLIDQQLNANLINTSNLSLNVPSSDVPILPSYIKAGNIKMNKPEVNMEDRTEIKPDIKSGVKIERTLNVILDSSRTSTISESKIKRCPAKDCNKRLGISNNFECKCGIVTCMLHRYPNDHQCPIDYKKIAREKLEKDNPVIIADKLPGRI